ncbi:General secretion pathway protein E [Myxococcus hansupus]|uniref:General secretion pathway protein E n=1 Tax=Pseudomyxococcus hansupus TaxID=1297742 RepID=A0A0H4X6K1_9BACT|nr:ATPase, T2SS/T4P/T4SS family [Myxococcus hansupus]AKQ69528.1 General secretion pathway protein E [Myxococcus hansupus]
MSSPSSPIAAVIAGLLDTLNRESLPVAAPPSVQTFDEAARALYSIAAQTRATRFSVWADTLDDGQDGAGISLFYDVPEAPNPTGLLGGEQRAVRHPVDVSLHGPLTDAMAALAKRGADALRPNRGSVNVPLDAASPELEFRVVFQPGTLGPWVISVARDSRVRDAFPPLSSLPLSAEEARFLSERFLKLDTLLQGQMVLFTGARGSGRTTSLHAAIEALPDDVRGLAALEAPRASDIRIGITRPDGETAMPGTLRAFLRQDPDLVFADEVRSDDAMKLLINSALTGHGAVGVLEATTPEAALQRVRAALPGIPVAPLFVHHSVDAASGERSMALYRVAQDNADHLERWKPD